MVVAVIVGLLTMHAPDPGGADHAAASGHAALALDTAAGRADHTGRAAAAVHAARAGAPVATVLAGLPGQTDSGASCIGCGTQGHTGQAIGCLLILVLAILLLPAPGRAFLRGAPARAGAGWWPVGRIAVPRPPSLAVLCISRT
nr:DUF6153 family protein [Cellulomonas denverensis]